MSDRPLHFLTLDRLAVMGNRSYQNPFLAKSYELFLGPFGISPNYVEISLVGCAAGDLPPLYLHDPRFRPLLVRQMGLHTALFQPILDAGPSAEVTALTNARMSVRCRRTAGNGDLYAEALSAALGQGLELSINAALAQAEEYFRGFLAAAVRLLGDAESDPAMLDLFLSSPGDFALSLAQQLGSATETAAPIALP